MLVKGTTIVARREQITRMFGRERWDAFMESMAREDQAFGDRIFITSRIPLKSFLRFSEMLIDVFFNGDIEAYSMIGATSAEWVFTDGPYRGVLDRGEVGLARFIQNVSGELWDKYYDFGELIVEEGESTITVQMRGIPTNHPYFELTVSGFMVRAVELAGLRSPVLAREKNDTDGEFVFRVEHQGWIWEE